MKRENSNIESESEFPFDYDDFGNEDCEYLCDDVSDQFYDENY